MLNGKKIVAFICECNPFHEGHKRLINSAFKEGDIIIAIMSGNFVQRGEPAIYDKYKRCSELLKNGVSMVIELPIEYSLSSAKYFASYSIAIINKLKFVDKLIFGSKINNIDKLSEFAYININLDENNDVKKYLKEGYSYSYAISKIYGKKLSPNDILAVEYISALKQTKSKIIPICIKRNNDLPTASELRKKIIPAIKNDDFSSILNFKLLLAKNKICNFSNSYLMTDDLYNAILKSSNKNLSFTKRAKLLQTKNITLANIKRVLLNIVIGINKNNIGMNLDTTTNPKIKIDYIRILGLKKDFTSYLKQIKIPYLLSYNNNAYKAFVKNFPKSNVIKLNKNGEYKFSPSIMINIFASNLYNLFSKSKNTEATTKSLIL